MRIDLLLNHTHFIDRISELKLKEFGYLVPNKTIDDVVNGLKEHCNDVSLPITWVALEGQDFVGTFSIRACDLPSHKHFAPWLGSLVVPPEKRNKGIGAYLVKQSEKIAANMGYEFLYLFTPNKAAWYEKLGWEAVESLSFNNIPITIMQKSIFPKK